MAGVHPYALVPENPETEVRVCWVDDTGDGGGTQSAEIDGTTSESDGESIPESSGAYLYDVTVTDLSPDTDYEVTINSSETLTETVRTLPSTLSREIRLCVISDLHPFREDGMEDRAGGPEPMERLGNENPDLVLIPGDIMTNTESQTTENTDLWLTFWNEYAAAMNSDRLKPIFAIPGNHEVGNGAWTGTTSEEIYPERGYFQLFFPNTVELDPAGENYGAITVGDYLQLVGLDAYSAYPADQRTWMQDTIDESVDEVIPMMHLPLLLGSGMDTDADELVFKIQREWASVLDSFSNVRTTFDGHIHIRKFTHPWTVVDTEPSHSESYDLDGDGYLVTNEGGDGIVSFGDGWMADYPNDTSGHEKWFLDYEAKWEERFYSIGLGTDTNVVSEIGIGGDVLETHTVRGPTSMDEYNTTGSLQTGRLEVTDGGIQVGEAEFEQGEKDGVELTPEGALRLAMTTAVPSSTVLHLDATELSSLLSSDAQVSDGDTIDEWADQTDSGWNLTGGSPTRQDDVQDGNTVVRFNDDSINRAASDITTISQPFTVIFSLFNLSELSDGSVYNQVLGVENSEDSEVNLTYNTDDDTWDMYAGDSEISGGGQKSAIVSAVYNGPDSVLRQNGSEVASGDVGTNAMESLQLGNTAIDPSRPLNADIGTFMICDDDLNETDEIEDEEQRQANKWGMTLS